MNVIAAYVIAKENENRKIADKTAQLYFEGMSYEQRFKGAEGYIRRRVFRKRTASSKALRKKGHSMFKE